MYIPHSGAPDWCRNLVLKLYYKIPAAISWRRNEDKENMPEWRKRRYGNDVRDNAGMRVRKVVPEWCLSILIPGEGVTEFFGKKRECFFECFSAVIFPSFLSVPRNLLWLHRWAAIFPRRILLFGCSFWLILSRNPKRRLQQTSLVGLWFALR